MLKAGRVAIGIAIGVILLCIIGIIDGWLVIAPAEIIEIRSETLAIQRVREVRHQYDDLMLRQGELIRTHESKEKTHISASKQKCIGGQRFEKIDGGWQQAGKC